MLWALFHVWADVEWTAEPEIWRVVVNALRWHPFPIGYPRRRG